MSNVFTNAARALETSCEQAVSFLLWCFLWNVAETRWVF